MEKFYATDIKTKEGFFEIQGRLRFGSETKIYPIRVNPDNIHDGWKHWYFGKDAFRSPEEASAKARELRAKKIASLRKQLDKLEELDK